MRKPDQIEREAVRLAWRALLDRQHADRLTLARNQEEERHLFYRENKAAMDERNEGGIAR